jgi:tRNA (L-threonylcarbamoyladenosine(37)-C2) methyltransferase TrmO-like protein
MRPIPLHGFEPLAMFGRCCDRLPMPLGKTQRGVAIRRIHFQVCSRRDLPHRPNPLGLHRVRIHEISALRLHVGPLEAIDGTPVVDIKPALDDGADL